MGIQQKVKDFLKPMICEPELSDSKYEVGVLQNQLSVCQSANMDTNQLLTDLAKAKHDYQDSLLARATCEDQLNAKTNALTACLAQVPTLPSEKEIFWNNKYPKKDIRYQCRFVVNAGVNTPVSVDLRNFWNLYDADLKTIASQINLTLTDHSNDSKSLACLRYVRKNFVYTSDQLVEGVAEFWQTTNEALALKKGDCEDGAILLANLMYHIGIPYWRIHLNAGDVNGGGHAYVTYCRETDNEFVTMDWCYWPNDLPVAQRKLHKDERDYYGIWWSWTYKDCFTNFTYAEKDGMTLDESRLP